MIYIDAEQLFALYAVLGILAVAVLWFRHEWIRESSDWTITKDQLYRCTRCHYTFLAQNDSENITRCPRCNEMCFLRKKKRF